MRAYQAALMIGVAFVLHAGTSASEAGWFRGRNTCYYYPADSVHYAATSPAPSAVPRAHCGDIVFGNEPGTNGGAVQHCGDIVFGSGAQPERIFRFGSGEQSERIFRLRMDLGAGDRIPRWSRPQVLGRIR